MSRLFHARRRLREKLSAELFAGGRWGRPDGERARPRTDARTSSWRWPTSTASSRRTRARRSKRACEREPALAREVAAQQRLARPRARTPRRREPIGPRVARARARRRRSARLARARAGRCSCVGLLGLARLARAGPGVRAGRACRWPAPLLARRWPSSLLSCARCARAAHATLRPLPRRAAMILVTTDARPRPRDRERPRPRARQHRARRARSARPAAPGSRTSSAARSTSTRSSWRESREQALDRMVAEARARGADAVVGVRFVDLRDRGRRGRVPGLRHGGQARAGPA